MNPANTRIRRGTPADLPAMSEVHRAAIERSKAPLSYRLAEALELPEASLLVNPADFTFRWECNVVEVDGTVVGFSGWKYDPQTRIGEVKGNYVHADFWGRGLGKILVRSVNEHLACIGARIVKVRTEESNAVARHVYESFGGSLLVTASHYARKLEKADRFEYRADESGIIRDATKADAAEMFDLELDNAERYRASEMLLQQERHGLIAEISWKRRHAPHNDVSQTLVLEHNGNIAGYIKRHGPSVDSHGSLSHLTVRRGCETDGTSDLLVRTSLELLRDCGVPVVHQEVLETDIVACNAYVRTGFVRIGAIVIYTSELVDSR